MHDFFIWPMWIKFGNLAHCTIISDGDDFCSWLLFFTWSKKIEAEKMEFCCKHDSLSTKKMHGKRRPFQDGGGEKLWLFSDQAMKEGAALPVFDHRSSRGVMQRGKD
jgi:hypothetical protein